MKTGGHFHEMAGKCQVSDCYHKHCVYDICMRLGRLLPHTRIQYH